MAKINLSKRRSMFLKLMLIQRIQTNFVISRTTASATFGFFHACKIPNKKCRSKRS